MPGQNNEAGKKKFRAALFGPGTVKETFRPRIRISDPKFKTKVKNASYSWTPHMSLYIFYRQSNQLDEADSEQLVADTINQRVAKLEDEMEQNLSMMGSIKDKVSTLFRTHENLASLIFSLIFEFYFV